MTPILTKRLKLILESPAEARARIEAMTPSERAQMSADWLARFHSAASSDPWVHGFAMVHQASGIIVGAIGFTGPPGPGDDVEIACGVDPEHQGKGYATEAAEALTAFAFDSGGVRVVRAHTLPEPNASTRVLTKCGFKKISEVIDPEDGLVWR